MDSSSPTSVVTFLLTDVVGSTRLWRESPMAGAALARQADLIAEAVARHRGERPPDQGEGDSTLAVFSSAASALAAALDAQRALHAEAWPEGASVSVRMAVHSGDAERRRDGNYAGLAVIRAARLRECAHGGQVLVSAAAAELAGERLPDGASLAELGVVSLAGLERPERVHRLCHPDLPAPSAMVGSLRTSPAASLGHWPTPLIGRVQEREDVAALLETERLVTITGVGGSGKTRLAHAVGEDRAGRHADGVVWVDLARISTEEQVPGAVVAACGLAEMPGTSALQVLMDRMANADALLILDNCEHLLGACAALAEALLRSGPRVRILATAREPLGVTGEVGWRIPSLPLPEENERDPERLLASDAVRLFVERARAARPDFVLDAASAPAVVRICRRLDGIPLALELAAARVRALSAERLADGLDDRFRLLTGGARTAIARQRTLLASVEWSHDLLDPDERTLFRRLAVFASPFSLDAAEAVAADEELDRFAVFDLLARLVDKSVVVHGGERYRMLETLRQYALERADDAGELAALRDRHLAWFRQRAAAWALDREVATEPLVAEVTEEAPDLVAALDWSCTAGQSLAVELLHPLGQYWNHCLLYEEAGALAGRLLARLEPGSDPWIEALAPVALVLFLAGDASWQPSAREALESGREIPAGVRGRLEEALGFALAFVGMPEGLERLRRAIDASREAGARGAEVDATARLAAILATYGLRAEATPLIGWLERRMPADAATRFLLEMAGAAHALEEPDFARARALLVRPSRARGQRVGTSGWLTFLGFWTEDPSIVRESLNAFDHGGALGVFEGYRIWPEVALALLEGNVEGACRRLDASRDAPGIMGFWLRHLRAALALAAGEDAETEAILDEVAPHLENTNAVLIRAGHDLLCSELARRRGETWEAEVRAHAALASGVRHDLRLLEVDALEMLSTVFADVGRLDEAARLLGATEAFRARTGFRWCMPYRRHAIEAMRPRLHPGALEEGAALGLSEAVAYASRGRGERRRSDHGWESLTPSEQRVVELVAAGLPNKEIAARLFVSVATVKTHLVHVYAKLELRTRAELAAAVARRLSEGAPPGVEQRRPG
jgi:predicted ATPase/class 3 adenylate cyclase/DNA-binding CsgD family transcriptional regulator